MAPIIEFLDIQNTNYYGNRVFVMNIIPKKFQIFKI